MSNGHVGWGKVHDMVLKNEEDMYNSMIDHLNKSKDLKQLFSKGKGSQSPTSSKRSRPRGTSRFKLSLNTSHRFDRINGLSKQSISPRRSQGLNPERLLVSKSKSNFDSMRLSCSPNNKNGIQFSQDISPNISPIARLPSKRLGSLDV